MASRNIVEVVLDAPGIGRATVVGSLAFIPNTDTPPSFVYSDEWLSSPGAFPLGPDLELYRGPQYPATGRGLFGFMADGSPDRWGQRLLARREGSLARAEGRRPRALYGPDILLGIEDATRMGAIRYRVREGEPFLAAAEQPIPSLARLRRLGQAARRFEQSSQAGVEDDSPDLLDLFAPGSPLGGARPKAVIEHEGILYLAKFPSADDLRDVGGWEYLVHALGSQVGLSLPAAQIMKSSGGHRIYLSARFDRNRPERIHYASAMSLLNRRDGEEGASYLDLADLVAREGVRGRVEGDLEELFTRVVFNVAVGNRDDHLRNHGFLRAPGGWRLAPAFDVNPNPEKREHQLALDEASYAGDVDTVMRTCRHYQIKEGRAEEIAARVLAVVGTWRAKARSLGLKESEISLMEGSFAAGEDGKPPTEKKPRRDKGIEC